jgi:anthranilate synthase/aminodeoxychorismate synthase-like glutamine amidotransferase
MRLRQNKRVLLLDNYDSFTNNLAEQFNRLGCQVLTSRVDEYSVSYAKELNPTHLFITPGNGDYNGHGLRLQEFVHAFHQDIPISGVCLGHQSIAAYFGAKIDMNIQSLRGIQTECTHDGKGLFTGLPKTFKVGRYHNDVVNEESLKDTPLTATAWSEGLTMAVRHDTLPIESLQLHPESQLTEFGDEILQNFLNLG